MMYTLINILHNFKPRCLLRRMAIRALVHFWECATWYVSKLHSGFLGEMQKRRTEHRWTHLEHSCDVQIGQNKHLSAPLSRARSQECSSEVVRQTDGTGTFLLHEVFSNPARKVRPKTTHVERNKKMTRSTRPSERHPTFPLSCEAGEEHAPSHSCQKGE